MAPSGSAHSRKKVPSSLRLRSIEGRPFEAVRSRADSFSSEARAAQDKPGNGGDQDDQGEGNREEVEGPEGQHRKANENPVIDGALPDSQDRLDHDRYHHRLDPVQKTSYRRHIRVGHGKIREQPQHEDGGDHEERAGHDAAERPVQPPSDVGRNLLCFWAGEEHTEVERPQVLLLGDPPFPLHKLAVHDGDLSRRTPEVDKTKLHPEPERLPEANRLGLPGTVLHNGLSIHTISTTLVNNTARRRATTVTRAPKTFDMMCYR